MWEEVNDVVKWHTHGAELNEYIADWYVPPVEEGEVDNQAPRRKTRTPPCLHPLALYGPTHR
jgi:hypothetical protein